MIATLRQIYVCVCALRVECDANSNASCCVCYSCSERLQEVDDDELVGRLFMLYGVQIAIADSKPQRFCLNIFCCISCDRTTVIISMATATITTMAVKTRLSRREDLAPTRDSRLLNQ